MEVARAMDYQKLFRSTEKNGFNRDDVIRYMEETERNTQSAQAELKDQIELLTQSREELTQEVSACGTISTQNWNKSSKSWMKR